MQNCVGGSLLQIIVLFIKCGVRYNVILVWFQAALDELSAELKTLIDVQTSQAAEKERSTSLVCIQTSDSQKRHYMLWSLTF